MEKQLDEIIQMAETAGANAGVTESAPAELKRLADAVVRLATLIRDQLPTKRSEDINPATGRFD